MRDGEIVARTVAIKTLAIHAAPAGGTQEQAIEPERQALPALTDAQVVRLAQLGRRIEAHFGAPQDIEWCLVHDGFHIVQSRPITTLFPIPAAGDEENHVYVSVGHQQMMITSYSSDDGAQWNAIGSDPTALGATAYVGIAVTGHEPYERASATFSNLRVSPVAAPSGGLKSADIGGP